MESLKTVTELSKELFKGKYRSVDFKKALGAPEKKENRGTRSVNLHDPMLFSISKYRRDLRAEKKNRLRAEFFERKLLKIGAKRFMGAGSHLMIYKKRIFNCSNEQGFFYNQNFIKKWLKVK